MSSKKSGGSPKQAKGKAAATPAASPEKSAVEPPPANSYLTLRLSEESKVKISDFQDKLMNGKGGLWIWLFADKPAPELAAASREEQELLAIQLQPTKGPNINIPLIQFGDYLETEGTKLALRHLYEAVKKSAAITLDTDIYPEFLTRKIGILSSGKTGNLLVMEVDFLAKRDEETTRALFQDVYKALRRNKIELLNMPAADDPDPSSKWNPYIVLGKLANSKKRHLEFMKFRRLRVNSDEEKFRVEAVGFGMGGDIPSKNADLKWNTGLDYHRRESLDLYTGEKFKKKPEYADDEAVEWTGAVDLLKEAGQEEILKEAGVADGLKLI